MILTKTSEGSVEGSEGGDDTHATTGLGHSLVASVVTGGEEPESDLEEEEDEEERDRGAEGAEQEDEGDDGPHGQVDGERIVKHVTLARVGSENLELGNVENAEGDPERAVRGEGRRTESVTARPLLNTGNDLSKTTVAKSETKDNVGDSDVARLGVVKRENKGSTTETAMLGK